MRGKDFAKRANTQNLRRAVNLVVALQLFRTLLLGAGASPYLTTFWRLRFVILVRLYFLDPSLLLR